VLVVAEIVILFVGILALRVPSPAGVVRRAGPILSLWLAVLGAALAFRRGETCA
jgi:hypothetical protein